MDRSREADQLVNRWGEGIVARTGSPPVYLQIGAYLRKLVEAGVAGDPMPSDSDLSVRFGVSRMTCRQAMRDLVAEGLVYRVPGRGSFIGDRHVHRALNVLRSFTEEMAARGSTVSSTVLSSMLRPGTPQETAALQLAPGDQVASVARVRFADRVPLALERVALVPECSPVLDNDLAVTSLHEALRQVGRVPTLARGSLTAVLAGELEAQLLAVAPGAPLLSERRTVVDQHGVPIEHTETRYVSDRFVFDIVLGRA